MNSELDNIEPEKVRKKITNDQALTLAELAVGFCLPYTTVKALAKEKGFPKVGAYVFPSDFKIWRRQTRGLQSSPGTPVPAGRPSVGKSGEFQVKHG